MQGTGTYTMTADELMKLALPKIKAALAPHYYIRHEIAEDAHLGISHYGVDVFYTTEANYKASKKLFRKVAITSLKTHYRYRDLVNLARPELDRLLAGLGLKLRVDYMGVFDFFSHPQWGKGLQIPVVQLPAKEK